MMYKVVRRVTSLLDKNVDFVDNNVFYGDYPHILYYNGKLIQFDENYEAQRSNITYDWACPIGIPIGVNLTFGVRGDKKIVAYIGYIIGEKVYIHKTRYNHFGSNEVTIPTENRIVDVTPTGWTGDLASLSSFVLKSSFLGNPKFLRTMFSVQLTSSCMADMDALNRDGWIVNQLYGRQAFIGIRTAKVYRNGDILWSNRYLANVCKDRGITVTGMLFKDYMSHPHVDGNFKLCTNEWEGAFMTRIQSGDYTAVFYLLTDFLNSYSSQSPYFDLPIVELDRLEGSKYFKSHINKYYRTREEADEEYGLYEDDDDDDYDEDEDEY